MLDTEWYGIELNATAPITASVVERPRPAAADADRASAGRFEDLWAALRAAPARKRPERMPDPYSAEPVLVSAASMNTALAKVAPDRATLALTAFKRESWLTFTNAAAASSYASGVAERGGPAVAPVDSPRNGVVADLRAELHEGG